MKIVARLCPCLALASHGHLLAALLCLLLQLTLVGWIPAASYALRVIEDHQDQVRLQRALQARYLSRRRAANW
jgi:hypothetical protein